MFAPQIGTPRATIARRTDRLKPIRGSDTHYGFATDLRFRIAITWTGPAELRTDR